MSGVLYKERLRARFLQDLHRFHILWAGSPSSLHHFVFSSLYYPEIRTDRGTAELWNPVLKRRYVARPEERVRLCFIDMLLTENLFPSTRIGFEVPVDAMHADSATRADIVLYDEDFKPWMLVECKAPGVPVTEATAIQAAQYNRRLAAPWVVLTNGIRVLATLHGRISDAPLVAPLLERLSGHNGRIIDAPIVAPLNYWLDRGFLSPSTSTEEWVALCNQIYKGSYPVRYSETPVPGWQAAVGGWGLCLNAGRLVAWNTEKMIEFEGGSVREWVRRIISTQL